MQKKNAAAVALGKLRAESMTAEERQDLARSGGLKGGKARAKSLTKEQRKAIASKASKARWGDKPKKTTGK
jgi:hypothetical protein